MVTNSRQLSFGRTTVVALIGCAALAAIVGWWTWRAVHEPLTLDFGLAYNAGKVTWATGHPEYLPSWDGMPFMAAALALVGRVLSVGTATTLWVSLNTVVVIAVLAVTLHRLRRVLSPTWLWVLAFALVTFGPLMSSVWWKQFNIVALSLALAGFELIHKKADSRGAALIGLSVSLKPLAILLPFVLLASRRTRRAGAEALAWVIGLNMAAQVLFASRAGDLGALSPWPSLHNFILKARPQDIWACHTENFAPGSLLCRVAGAQHWTIQHILVWCMVGLLGLWIFDAVRHRSTATSWEVFAFTLPLSVMASPIAWSHYQIMLAPLFVLLVVRFSREGARPGDWAGLAAAFVLASLIWQPYGTILSLVGHSVTQQGLFWVEDIAQFAQYVLVITGVVWYAHSAARSARAD